MISKDMDNIEKMILEDYNVVDRIGNYLYEDDLVIFVFDGTIYTGTVKSIVGKWTKQFDEDFPYELENVEWREMKKLHDRDVDTPWNVGMPNEVWCFIECQDVQSRIFLKADEVLKIQKRQ